MCQYTSRYARALLLSVAALTACGGTRPSGPIAPTDVIAITHANVIDVVLGVGLPDETVLVSGGTISSIGPEATVAIPHGAQVFDARNGYLIPGLWDMHVHLTTEGRAAAGEYITHGITSVRDMGGQLEAIDSLRRSIARHEHTGPRILAAGPMIENADAMKGILLKASTEDSADARRDRLLLPDPERATRAVDSLARLGVDMIKARDFTDARTYWAIAGAARRAHLAFVGHAPFGLDVDPVALADSGQHTIEHWYYPTNLPTLPSAEYERIVAAYVARGTALTPTLNAWRQHRFTVPVLRARLDSARRDPRSAGAPRLIAHWERELNDREGENGGTPYTSSQLKGWNVVLDDYAKQSGILGSRGMVLLAGSDLPFARYSGEGLQDELALLVHEGHLTAAQALRTATIAPARNLGLQDTLGALAHGFIADLVLLDANPLSDIENVRTVRAVMQAGRWTWQKTTDRSMPQ